MQKFTPFQGFMPFQLINSNIEDHDIHFCLCILRGTSSVANKISFSITDLAKVAALQIIRSPRGFILL